MMRGLHLGLAAALATSGLIGVTALPAAAEGDECVVGTTAYVKDISKAVNLTSVGFRQSWREATGSGVTVAVVDSGVDDGNEHLAGAVLKGTSFVGGDPTGRSDDYGHGTAVAGIIAARPLDKSSLIGAAFGATILPVRVYVQKPSTTLVAKGIRWAADHGADVINVSISTGASDPQIPELRSAVDYAQRKGALIVAAGGNQVKDVPLTQERYPAQIDGVLGVAAANLSGSVDDWSIHGPHNDVSAPGQNPLITFHDNGDCIAGSSQGQSYTSYATAYVSGLAAQLMEKFPKESAQQIANRIMSTADRPRISERDDLQGWGLIQPYAALTSSSDSAPGTAAASAETRTGKTLLTMKNTGDPMSSSRTTILWLAIAAGGLMAVALIIRPLVRRP